jgi:hypothetical protein
MRNSRPIMRMCSIRSAGWWRCARTTTASVCVPALPPMPETIGISTASSEARDLALNSAMTTEPRSSRCRD